MLARLKRLLDWAIYHALLSPAPAGRPNRDEQHAAMHIWPTTGRRVMATPKRRPRGVSAPAAVTGGRISDDTGV